jgi:hypothetical protein
VRSLCDLRKTAPMFRVAPFDSYRRAPVRTPRTTRAHAVVYNSVHVCSRRNDHECCTTQYSNCTWTGRARPSVGHQCLCAYVWRLSAFWRARGRSTWATPGTYPRTQCFLTGLLPRWKRQPRKRSDWRKSVTRTRWGFGFAGIHVSGCRSLFCRSKT